MTFWSRPLVQASFFVCLFEHFITPEEKQEGNTVHVRCLSDHIFVSVYGVQVEGVHYYCNFEVILNEVRLDLLLVFLKKTFSLNWLVI